MTSIPADQRQVFSITQFRSTWYVWHSCLLIFSIRWRNLRALAEKLITPASNLPLAPSKVSRFGHHHASDARRHRGRGYRDAEAHQRKLVAKSWRPINTSRRSGWKKSSASRRHKTFIYAALSSNQPSSRSAVTNASSKRACAAS